MGLYCASASGQRWSASRCALLRDCSLSLVGSAGWKSTSLLRGTCCADWGCGPRPRVHRLAVGVLPAELPWDAAARRRWMHAKRLGSLSPPPLRGLDRLQTPAQPRLHRSQLSSESRMAMQEVYGDPGGSRAALSSFPAVGRRSVTFCGTMASAPRTDALQEFASLGAADAPSGHEPTFAGAGSG